jgi:hypothetical protein
MTSSFRKLKALITSSHTNHGKSVCISSNVNDIKLVHFSSNIDVEYIKYSREEDTNKWYSDHDIEMFELQVLFDANYCSLMVDLSIGEKENLDYTYVGLEHLISHEDDAGKCFETFKEARKDHTRKVLAEQEHQRSTNPCSTVNLMYVSNASSQFSRARAYKFAKMMAMAKC